MGPFRLPLKVFQEPLEHTNDVCVCVCVSRKGGDVSELVQTVGKSNWVKMLLLKFTSKQ